MRNICGIIDWKKKERSPTWYWLLGDRFGRLIIASKTSKLQKL
ncbi:MAG: hypothetical protein AB4063_06960 [Crocosphaera sp.]